MIDRVYLKQASREAMRGKNPSVYLVSFIFIVITTILGNLNITIQMGNWDIESMMEAMMAGKEIIMEQIGLWGTVILIAITLMTTVINAGYSWYCMEISRGIKAGVGDIFDGFGIFFKIIWLSIVAGFFVFLWSLLLIIPGIIASYRYCMAIYILMDDPDKSVMQCIRESKAITKGYKWSIFVLQLSFIGWNILCIIPFVTIFVTPYYGITFANYYNTLSGWKAESEESIYESEYKDPWDQQ